jgi:GNAT superfamily N-acetyltransferase
MPPRGQKLFVRPITYGDMADLRRLTGTEMTLPPNGLLGRLVGDTVSFLVFAPTDGGEIRIDDIFVAPDLRRKRVGRVLIGELEEVARQLQCTAMTVNPECRAKEFFVKMGFVETKSLFRKSIQ